MTEPLPELNDVEFLDHCERVVKANQPLHPVDAGRLFTLGGASDLGEVLSEAAGLIPYYFPTTGPIMIAEARTRLGLTKH
jgi:hypothetical protein